MIFFLNLFVSGFSVFAKLNETRTFLCHDGFRYGRNRVSGDMTYWKCCEYHSTKCKGRVSTRIINGYEMMRMNNPHHNHERRIMEKTTNSTIEKD